MPAKTPLKVLGFGTTLPLYLTMISFGMMQIELLSLVIWFPIVGGILVLATGGEQNAPVARKLALGFSVATFLLSLPLYTGFDNTTAAMQFVERKAWIDLLHIEYYLGVDGISMPFILLTTFLTVVVVIARWEVIQQRTAQYMAAFLIMEGLMIGVFCALDSILFYLFWEAMLVPMYLIIGISPIKSNSV